MSDKKGAYKYFYLSLGTLVLVYLTFFSFLQYYINLADLYDHKRLASIFLLVATGVVLIANRVLQSQCLRLWKLFPSTIRGVFFIILCLGSLSALWAEFPSLAWLDITQFCLLFLFILVVALAVREYPIYARYLLLLIAVGFAILFLMRFSFSFIKTYVAVYPLIPRGDTFVGAYSFVYIRMFNHLQTITLPLLGTAVFYAQKRSKVLGVIIFLLLSGWWMLVFISGARGTLLASLVGIGLVSLLFFRSIWPWLKIQLIGFTLGAVGYLSVFGFSFSESTGRAITRTSSSGRLDFWWEMMLGILQQPILGYGPMQSSIKGLGLHGHNYFLTMAYEWGLPAAILLTGILGYGLYFFFKKIKSEELGKKEQIFRIGLMATLISIWVHSLLAGIINAPMSQIWVALCLATAIGIYYQDIPMTEETGTKYNWKFSLFAVISLCVFLWSVYPTVFTFNQRQEKFIEYYGHTTLWPRFWQQGKIGWEDSEKNKEILERYDHNE